MGDSDKPEDPAPAVASAASTPSLEQARKFLQNDAVRSESRERKIEFLKTKGIQEDRIIELLESDDPTDTNSTVCLPKGTPLLPRLFEANIRLTSSPAEGGARIRETSYKAPCNLYLSLDPTNRIWMSG